LKFGVSPSPFIWWRGLEEFVNWISEVESCGYDGVYIPDHYDLPFPGAPSNELVETWTTLAYIAARTKNLRVGSMVSPLPRYLPSQLAKIIAHVDVLSRGRVTMGVGAGWYREEFVNYSPQGVYEEPRVRVERVEEGLQVMIKLWTEERATFRGKYYKLEGAVLLPKPVQKPHPPIWSGGFGPRMLRISAKYCNGLLVRARPRPITPEQLGYGLPPEEYGEKVRKVRKYLRDYGRSEEGFTFAILDWMPEDKERIKDVVKVLEKYVDHGCQYYIVEIPLKQPLRNGRYIELVRAFAREVMPSFC